MSADVTHWDIIGILKAPSADGRKPAIVILNQPIAHSALFQNIFTSCSPRVAADGGGTRLFQLAQQVRKDGVSPYDALNFIVGDMDSISDQALQYFTIQTPRPAQVVRQPDQGSNSTDFGKAIRFIRDVDMNALPDVIAVGGCGGRVDQGVAQLHHLYMFHNPLSRIFLLSDESLTFLLPAGKHEICVRDGDAEVFAKWVGILPMNGVAHITTKGLEWDVTDWETSFPGAMSTSNHVLPETTSVHVETDNGVLFTIALKSTIASNTPCTSGSNN
ncbi:hypothetical protein BROUX41_004756 [Berkeleyomyces rouxiae]|uniref:uncharacterized protein n=1 Tax=Berkeleyomyces rouxiae TaxID=2035830 RepID=UPI003B769003